MYACNAVTLAQLLSARDGEPVEASAQRHIEHCEHCSRELSRLHEVRTTLRSLPELAAPPIDLVALRAQTSSRVHRLATAAGIVALGALSAFLVASQLTEPDQQQMTAATPAAPDQTAAVATAPSTSGSGPNLNSLVIRSQELESRLRRLPQRPSVERASTTLTIDSLQDRIQWVDYQLSLAQEVGMTDRQTVQLWQDRVRLMDSLVKVRYAEAQRTAYLVPASWSSL